MDDCRSSSKMRHVISSTASFFNNIHKQFSGNSGGSSNRIVAAAVAAVSSTTGSAKCVRYLPVHCLLPTTTRAVTTKRHQHPEPVAVVFVVVTIKNPTIIVPILVTGRWLT
jgi:hypothetical protein